MDKYKFILLLVFLSIYSLCFSQEKVTNKENVEMVSIRNDKFKVWTKKVGNGNRKLLLLHGGPGTSPEYFFNFPENLSKDYTIFYYSQLGTHFSDIPKDSTLYNLDNFVEDVEEVRQKLKIDDFYLLGHSWGSYLAQAYAAKYQEHLKGIILCNNINEHNDLIADYGIQLYANIMYEFPEFKPYSDSLRFGFSGKFTEFDNPESLGSKIREKVWPEMVKRHYARLETYPEDLSNSKINSNGSLMQELGFHERVYRIDYNQYLVKLEKPVLFIGAKYDFIPPFYYVKMKDKLPKTTFSKVVITNGSHFTMWDDKETFFKAIDDFITDIEKK